MNKEPNLLLDVDSRGVATLTLNRPQVLNAFDEALIQALSDAFERLSADASVRVVVLAAAGRTFCSGADIGWMQRAAANTQEINLADARRFAVMMDKVDRCTKPVIARVQGAAYGGGVGLICAADIAIAESRSKFAISEAKFGILPAVIGPYVVNALGTREARRLALTCSVVDAAYAMKVGLVHEVAADPNELDQRVQDCIKELLVAGPKAQGEIKQLFSQLSVGAVTPEIQELTAQTISRVRSTEEARQGFECFVQKCAAPWVTPSLSERNPQ